MAGMPEIIWSRGHQDSGGGGRRLRFLAILTGCVVLCLPNVSMGEQALVRYTEGIAHGFLALRTLQGEKIADGETTQVAHGNRVTSHLVFRFKDGSLYDETTVFTQHGRFRLLSDHLIERGPSFKQPVATFINAATGQVTVRYKDGDKEKVRSQKLNLPPDLVNGILYTILKDIQPTAPQSTFSMLVASPKPRLVKLVILPQGEEAFRSAGGKREAVHYLMKVKIGGVAGVVAPLVGKQPPDTQIWLLAGDAPAFLRLEGPLYDGGPIWRIEMAVPAFPASGGKESK